MAYPLTLLGVTRANTGRARRPEHLDAPRSASRSSRSRADGTPVSGLDVLVERSHDVRPAAGGPARRPRRRARRRHPGRRRRRAGRGGQHAVHDRLGPPPDARPWSGSSTRCPPPACPTAPWSSTCPPCSPPATAAHRRPAPWSRRSGGSTRCRRPPCEDAVRTGLPAGATVVVRTDVVARAGGQPGERRDARRHAAGHRGRPGAGRRRLRGDDRGAGSHPPPRERRAARPGDAARPDPPGPRRSSGSASSCSPSPSGLVLGVLSALAVVPVLVGGDGHPQVPRVLVALPVAAGRRVRRGRRAGAVARRRARPAQHRARHLGRAAPRGGVVTGRHVARAASAAVAAARRRGSPAAAAADPAAPQPGRRAVHGRRSWRRSPW